ncbi:MAG: hypothetical protein SNJ75_12755, partial [Gemmataceae bacterium]
GRRGRWGYRPHHGEGTPAMTGVGLLGLGVGKGLNGVIDQPALEDPQIQNGLNALGHLLDHPEADNLYFLWTLERVGVLYGVKSIGQRDWYRYAVEKLLPKQREDGSWNLKGYPGSTTALDTCWALLILKRTNFVPELTRTLKSKSTLDR